MLLYEKLRKRTAVFASRFNEFEKTIPREKCSRTADLVIRESFFVENTSKLQNFSHKHDNAGFAW